LALSDFDLENYLKTRRLVIEPVHPDTVRENGVDLRVGESIARMRETDQLLDTRAEIDTRLFYDIVKGDEFVIRPREKVLICTMEYMELPAELMGFVELRSTFARCGLMLPPTIIDGGFKGQVTLEVEGSSFPVKLYKGDRFAHIVFLKLVSPIGKPYAGKYQGQRGVTLPRFDSRQ